MPFAGNINESDSDFSESFIENETHRFRDQSGTKKGESMERMGSAKMQPKLNDSILKIPYLNESINFTETDMKDEEQKTQNMKDLFIPYKI